MPAKNIPGHLRQSAESTTPTCYPKLEYWEKNNKVSSFFILLTEKEEDGGRKKTLPGGSVQECL